MKKIVLTLAVGILTALQSYSQCSFETLFPLPWGVSKYMINEKYNSNPVFKVGKDTITGSAFRHGLDYFFTARNMRLYFYSYNNAVPHPCFMSGNVTVNAIANDSGLVAYNYQVTFPADQRMAYAQAVDSLRKMMEKKYVYHSNVETKTEALDAAGNTLTGEGICVYYNDEPIINTNLTYPPFVIRAGYLAKSRTAQGSSGVILNQAENIAFYRIEILYKMKRDSW